MLYNIIDGSAANKRMNFFLHACDFWVAGQKVLKITTFVLFLS